MLEDVSFGGIDWGKLGYFPRFTETVVIDGAFCHKGRREAAVDKKL